MTTRVTENKPAAVDETIPEEPEETVESPAAPSGLGVGESLPSIQLKNEKNEDVDVSKITEGIVQTPHHDRPSPETL